MSDEKPSDCPSCGEKNCLVRDFSGISAVVDSNQPKTIGDLANKNTEDAVKRGELPKSALEWDANRKKRKDAKERVKKITNMTQQQKTDYIMTGKMP
jgi:hypothetical protein